MFRYITGRIASGTITLVIVSLLIFLLMHAIPGGPFGNIQSGLSPTTKANILRVYGLNKPWQIQYLDYMRGFVQLNLGVAWQNPGEPMATLIAQAFRVSLSVASIGLVYGVVGGLFLGVIASMKLTTWVDQVITIIMTALLTTPTYVISIALITIFAVWLRLFPAAGWGGWQYMVLPAVAYGINPLGTVARYTRNAMAEELFKQHVQVATAKGLSRWRTMIKHVLRNAAGPIVTIIAPMLPGLLTGSVFIEAIFNVPGLGAYFVSAIETRDYPLEMTLILFVTIFTIAIYLLSDLLLVAFDPRVQLGQVIYD